MLESSMSQLCSKIIISSPSASMQGIKRQGGFIKESETKQKYFDLSSVWARCWYYCMPSEICWSAKLNSVKKSIGQCLANYSLIKRKVLKLYASFFFITPKHRKFLHVIPKSSHPEVIYRKGLPKNFTKLTGKHLFRSLILIKRRLLQAFSSKFCDNLRNTHFVQLPLLLNSY